MKITICLLEIIKLKIQVCLPNMYALHKLSKFDKICGRISLGIGGIADVTNIFIRANKMLYINCEIFDKL